MKRKTVSIQIKAFTLLIIFFINLIALCSCGFAQLPTHRQDKKMMKNCCCCKHDSSKKDCKNHHTISFNEMDKTLVNVVSMQFSAIHYFLISHFISLPENNFSFIQSVYYQQVSVVDTSPPDLNILYRSFLI
ncbi:MAG: hypothetical protein PW786_05385 [Arachidicoccus sp.]|nr:hypothetical protein [Arachidicoccus sp.]